MTSYLLTIALGPVQDFIAAARKTRDLWYGSDLLSQTTRHAAAALHEAGATLVFPAPEALAADQDGRDVPIANKIVAVTPDGRDPAGLAARARAAAQDYLHGERDRALDKAHARGVLHLIDSDLLDAQLAGFLEFYSAWWPYDPDQPDTYSAARHHVESLLAGRKALRDFQPAAGREGVPKSALDGGRETVIRADREDAETLRRLSIKPGELLDGLSLIKRLAPRRRFVSTSRVAIDPLLRRVANDPRLREMETLAKELVGSDLVEPIPTGPDGLPQYAAFPFDTDQFYGAPSPGEQPDATIQERAVRFARTLNSMAREARVNELPAYLAVLVADGDHMGRTISALHSEQQHRAFSAASIAFAREARSIVAAHQGALVYSGGDDVLALLPLDRALACAQAVNDAFARAMAGVAPGSRITMSAGLAIGHYHESLQDLLRWGREAEQAAKQSRDALAVALYTRSAGDEAVVVTHRWTEQPLERWDRWVEWYRRDIVPDGAAYDLRTLARELRDLDRAGRGDVAAALAAVEAGRILKNKKGQRGTRSLEEPEIATILNSLSDASGHATLLERLETMVHEMIVARHIARVTDVAQGPLNGVEGGSHGH